MDRRVSARSMATASAARPPTSAISTPRELPPASGDTLATGVEPGAIVGNRPAALPPGLVEAAPPRGAVDIGDKAPPAGVAEACTTTEAVAAGSRDRLAAAPVTVRLTAVTVVAVSGTVTSAWNSRCEELASTSPRSHADVPLPLPQPKLKVGVPAPAVDCSWILASGTLPPTVQTPTAHRAACPRTLLCCSGRTPTHKVTGVVLAAWNAVRTMA